MKHPTDNMPMPHSKMLEQGEYYAVMGYEWEDIKEERRKAYDFAKVEDAALLRMALMALEAYESAAWVSEGSKQHGLLKALKQRLEDV